MESKLKYDLVKHGHGRIVTGFGIEIFFPGYYIVRARVNEANIVGVVEVTRFRVCVIHDTLVETVKLVVVVEYSYIRLVGQS